MSLIQNERTKLLANALDRASTACLTVGVFGPTVAFLYGAGTLKSSVIFFGLVSVIWIFIAVALHLLARRNLGALR